MLFRSNNSNFLISMSRASYMTTPTPAAGEDCMGSGVGSETISALEISLNGFEGKGLRRGIIGDTVLGGTSTVTNISAGASASQDDVSDELELMLMAEVRLRRLSDRSKADRLTRFFEVYALLYIFRNMSSETTGPSSLSSLFGTDC